MRLWQKGCDFVILPLSFSLSLFPDFHSESIPRGGKAAPQTHSSFKSKSNLDEKNSFLYSVSSPVTCVQLTPKPAALFHKPANGLRIPPHSTKPQLSSDFHWNSICCGFVPRAAQFLQFHTEFHWGSHLLLIRRDCADAPLHCGNPPIPPSLHTGGRLCSVFKKTNSHL